MPKKKSGTSTNAGKIAELKREVSYGKNNLARAEKAWKILCSKITLPKMRDEIISCWNYFEKALEIKDYVISLYMDDLRKHEDIYRMNLQKHQENMDELMLDLCDRLQKIHNDNNEILMDLIRKSLEDMQNQMQEAGTSENHLKTIKFGLEILTKNWNKTKKMEMFAQVNEETCKHNIKLQDLSFVLELKLEDLWNRIEQKEEEYSRRIRENRQHHEVLKELDELTTGNIQRELKKLTKLQVVAKRLTGRLKEMVSSIGDKVQHLEKERDSLSELQFFLRKKLHEDKINDEVKRKLLTVEFAEALDHLEVVMKKGQTMMTVLKGIRRFETINEKIFPYPFNYYGLESGNKCSPPQLHLFWQRVACAEAYRYTLNEERIFLKNENAKLMGKIHYYCGCLQCPVLPIPQRVGRIPYTEARDMVKKRMNQEGETKERVEEE